MSVATQAHGIASATRIAQLEAELTISHLDVVALAETWRHTSERYRWDHGCCWAQVGHRARAC